MAVQEYLQRAAGAVTGWYDQPNDEDVVSGGPTRAVPASQEQNPEQLPPDTTQTQWVSGTTGGIPNWAFLAGAGLGLVTLLVVLR